MALTQLCVARPSVLLPQRSRQALNKGSALSHSSCSGADWPAAPRQKPCTSARATLTTMSPTDESVADSGLQERYTQARLRKGRAAMRAWWYAKCLEKFESEADQAESDCVQAEAFVKQMEMAEGRAVMRLWWLEQQLGAFDPTQISKQGFLQNMWDRISKPARRARAPIARTSAPARLATPSKTHMTRSETNRAASQTNSMPSEKEATPFERQAALSEELAAPLDTLASENQQLSESDAATPSETMSMVSETQPMVSETRSTVSEGQSTASKSTSTVSEDRSDVSDGPTTPYETQAALSVEQAAKALITKESARTQARAKPVDDLIRKELEREAATRQRKAMGIQKGNQRKMDAGRAAMRKWWVREREATKRALGLAPYTPVWTVVRKDGKGDPISIGKTPLMAGSDVSNMQRVVPVQLAYPTVSRVHARIYGKDVSHHGNHTREYFVVDLKSTNGVRLNGSKRLRPGGEYKLNDGDVLMLGEEAATLTIKKPE